MKDFEKTGKTFVKYNVTDIAWDADEDALKGLPSEMDVYLPEMPEDEVADAISDVITDKTGFCHDGFAFDRTDETVDELRVETPGYGTVILTPDSNLDREPFYAMTAPDGGCYGDYCVDNMPATDITPELVEDQIDDNLCL